MVKNTQGGTRLGTTLCILAVSRSGFLFTDGAECTGKLVGTGCGFVSASYAFEAFHDLFGCHAFDEACYTLKIAMASTGESHLLDHAVLDSEIYLA